LIESIAVMAVIAILAAMAVPTIIRRVDRAAWTKETADLNAIGDAFTQSIFRTKTIPTFTNWASAVASQMSLPVSAVLTNGRRYARAFLIDPNVDIEGVDLTTVPYTQTINGTYKPNNARVMIVSSLSGPLENGIRSAPQDVPTFQALWDTTEGGTPAGWTMSGDDLRIKKLNLEPLFHQLILVKHDATNIPAPFTIDGSVTNTVATGALGRDKYFLDGTVLGLYGSAFNLQTRHLLTRSISFVFESGSWRGQLQGGETFSDTSGTNASTFLTLATTFYNKPVNPGAGSGASPSAVLISMYTFMFDYVFWATQCPTNFDWHGYNPGSNPSGLPEYRMLNDMGQNNGGVDGYSGGNSGLLK